MPVFVSKYVHGVFVKMSVYLCLDVFVCVCLNYMYTCLCLLGVFLNVSVGMCTCIHECMVVKFLSLCLYACIITIITFRTFTDKLFSETLLASDDQGSF